MAGISVGSVSVDVVPSAKNFASDLRRQLLPEARKLGDEVGKELSNRINAAMGDVRINADTRPAMDAADRLKADIAKDRPTVTVNADTVKADAELAVTQREVDKLNGETATVKVRESGVSKVNRDLQNTSRSASGLATAIIALAPAAVPALAVVAGGAVALSGALTTAAAGAGALALVAVPAFKDIATASKAQKAMNTAIATYGAGSTQAATATKKYQAALAQLSPAERTLKTSVDQAKTAFEQWQNALEPTVLPAMTQAINLLKPALNDLTPLVKGAAAGFTAFDGELKTLVNSSELKGLMTQFGAMAKQAIPALGQALINLGLGFGHLLVAFRPLTTEMLHGLVNLTNRFREWSSSLANSQGFHKFIDYINTNGPKLMHTLGDIGRGFVALLKAIAPLGPIYLDVIDKTVRLITAFVNAHPNITAFGVALLGIVKIGKQLKFASAISGVKNLIKAMKGEEVKGFAGGLQKAWGWAGKLGTAATGLTGVLGVGAGVGLTASLAAVAAGLGAVFYSAYKYVNGPSRGLNLAVVQNTQDIIKNAKSYQDAANQLNGQYAKAVKDNTKNVQRFGSAHNDLAGAERNFSGSAAQTAGTLKNHFGPAVHYASDLLNVGLTTAMKAANGAGIDLTKGFKGNSQAAQDNRKKLDALAVKLTGLPGQTRLASAGFATAADTTKKWSDRVNGLNGALDTLIGINVSTVQSQINFKQSTDAVTQSIKDNGVSLDANTAGGQANRQAILNEVQAAIQHAKAVYQQTHDLNKATDALKTDEGAIYDNATANGVNKGAVDNFLTSLGATVPQASDALKGMQDFASGTNTALQGIHDKNIKITATGQWSDGHGGHLDAISATGPQGYSGHYATGGAVHGRGTGTSDSIHAMLSNNEHVWTAREVQAAGGHAAVEHLRSRALAKTLPGFAAGGPVVSEAHFDPGILAGDVNSWLRDEISKWVKNLSAMFATSGDSGARSASAALAQRYAASALGRYGWGPGQMGALIPLWNRESGWNSYAVNPSSGAYGIPQSLGHGHPYNLGDYVTQVNWGLDYIASRYGSPAGALAHENAYGWYDNGGILQPGATMAFNGTGKNEFVFTQDQLESMQGSGMTNTIYVTESGVSADAVANEVIRRLEFAMR